MVEVSVDQAVLVVQEDSVAQEDSVEVSVDQAVSVVQEDSVEDSVDQEVLVVQEDLVAMVLHTDMAFKKQNKM